METTWEGRFAQVDLRTSDALTSSVDRAAKREPDAGRPCEEAERGVVLIGRNAAGMDVSNARKAHAAAAAADLLVAGLRLAATPHGEQR